MDRHTSRLWLLFNRAEGGEKVSKGGDLLVTYYTDNHGASFAPVCDITRTTKPAGMGWLANTFSGVQFHSGRLAICTVYLEHQTIAYPITHSRAALLVSDDHGQNWQFLLPGSPDGAEMSECAIAQLTNGTVVMNARDYLGQRNYSVNRAIMWSDSEGTNWSKPYFAPDLPTPIYIYAKARWSSVSTLQLPWA